MRKNVLRSAAGALLLYACSGALGPKRNAPTASTASAAPAPAAFAPAMAIPSVSAPMMPIEPEVQAPVVVPEAQDAGTAPETRSRAGMARFKVAGHVSPFHSELLNPAIELSDCPGIRIVEWKPTPGSEGKTSPSPDGVAVINRICKRAVAGFAPFLKKRGLAAAPDRCWKMNVSVSLLPGDLRNQGADYRNLNDSTFRFADRSKTYDATGEVIAIWGYHQRRDGHIFVANDPLGEDGKKNDRFVTVLAHEIFHLCSYTSGLFDKLDGDKSAADEKLARDFTRDFLGIGE